MRLVSWGSPFLKLNFYFPSWNPSCLILGRIFNSPYWKFLIFYPYSQENIQPPPPILKFSYILPKMLLLSFTSSLSGYSGRKSGVGTCFVSETSPSHTHTASGIVLTTKVVLNFPTLVHAQS
jgi:hypothetical protein